MMSHKQLLTAKLHCVPLSSNSFSSPSRIFVPLCLQLFLLCAFTFVLLHGGRTKSPETTTKGTVK